ncbi:conserved hypothetical protein [Rippkaea orientalis PCC 8801]|uniref:Uncharacterized protein n=1 Tax=Rippkaea orientalis (strain PCC 8801 / RF-1) TaxID=41431 RepID=B7K4G3_RIPO1|nr:hypothetical protein [Rippkaea orientalis]ACK65428.1 conserved hypothetical protein [Rippkaea orientalis PCC 8801]
MTMDKDTKFILLVLGLPIIGLVYCGAIIATLMTFPWTRHHPLIVGFFVMFVPFTFAASIWIRASAKAYQKNNIMMKSEE